MDAVQPAAVPPVRDAAADRLTIRTDDRRRGGDSFPAAFVFGEGPVSADDLAWRVERACTAAYPPLAIVRAGDWAVARSGGGSRRTNAASALTPGATLDAARLATIADHYAAAGLPTILRLTDLAPDASAFLDGRGFTAPEGGSRTLLRPAGPPCAAPADVVVAATPDPAWLAARRRLAPGIEDPAAVAARLAIPAAYAQRRRDGAVAAIGYVAVSDGIAIIEAVATAPESRRRGHASAIVAALVGWASDAGARHVALQVEATNAPARALYARLGFATDLYGYHYRRSPPCTPPDISRPA
jgi:ribosomal protein S18 acetylase RimI-like enzyme